MAKKYLDYDGLLYFWQKIKGTATPQMNGTAAVGTATSFSRQDHVHPSDDTKVDKENGKGLSTNDFTTALKNKLDGIATGAEVNQNAFSNVKIGSSTIAADGKTDTLEMVGGDGIALTADTTNDKVTIAADVSAANGLSINSSGKIALAVATTSAAGAMSSSDKTKLNGIATGAEVNQNAFSNIKVGDVTAAADTKTDTFEIVATSPITATGDATNDKVTIAHATSGVTAASKGDTSNKTPAFGGTFKALSGTVNSTGHLTSFGEHTVTIPTPNLYIEDLSSSDDTQVLRIKDGSGNAVGNSVTLNSIKRHAIDGTYLESPDFGLTHYAICSTAAATGAKVATISRVTNVENATAASYYLALGAIVYVNFTTNNTADPSSLTLNVNSTGAKSIRYHGSALPSASYLNTSRICCFVYDGTYWQIVGDIDTNTTYSLVTTTNPGLMDAADKRKLNKLVFDGSDKIDSSILPSYVDDVVEAYARSGQTALSSTWLATGSASGTVITPETGKIYILMADSGDYAANTQFRWSGSTYVKMADGGVSAITNTEIDTIMAL